MAGVRPRGRAGRRLPPPGALHRDHRGRARRGRQRAVRAARARRGDPPALHRADPAGPRRARDPRRAGARRSATRSCSRTPAARSSTTSPGRRATISRCRPGPTCTARRRAGRPPRACSRPTCGCSTPRGGGCWRWRWRTRSTTSTAWRSSAPRWRWRSTCSRQQHDEQLRARSRGAFLSDLADGRVEEADARRRAEALGFPGGRPRRAAAGRRHLARAGVRARAAAGPTPREARVADGITWTRLSGDLRAALSSTGPRRAARPARRRPADPARARRARLRRGAGRARRPPLPRRARPPRARPGATRRWRSAGRPTPGWRPARACGACAARRARRPRCRSPAGTTRAAPASPTSCTTCATRPELDAFVDEQLGPLLADGSPRTRALLETLEAYLAAGGRKAEAARALHLERQSLYLRLRRIEEALGVSLDDEDVVLGLHLAVRALPLPPPRLDGPSGDRRAERDVPPIAGARGAGPAWLA